MNTRQSIFDSNTELHIFKNIGSRWESKLKLYAQLPLAKLITVSAAELKPQEYEYYLKSNVDFTFCDLHGKPVLSIEFDGIGGGFSKDGKYVPMRKTIDPHRKLKLDFKLKLTKNANYPLIVISFDELEPFILEDPLLVVDGIIGQYLARQRFNELIKERRKYYEKSTETMSQEEQDDFLQNEVLDAEMEAELENDIIATEAARYEYMLYEKYGITSHSARHLEDNTIPQLPKNFDMFHMSKEDYEQFNKRIDALNKAQKIGYRVIVKTKSGNINTDVWIRTVDCPGISPLSIVSNIGEYVAFKRTYALLEKYHSKN